MRKKQDNASHILHDWHQSLLKIKKYSKHSCTAYLSDVTFFLEFLNKYHGEEVDLALLSEIDIEIVRAFLAERAKNKITAKTRSREISALKNFFIYLEDKYGLKLKAIDEITHPKLEKSLPKAINFEQVMKILENIKIEDNSWVGQRDYVIILLIYTTGIRISEALSVNKNAISKEHIIVKGKGNKERYVPLLPNVYQELKLYLKHLPYSLAAGQEIFVGVKGKVLNPRVIQKKIQNLRQQFLLPDFATPHALRHSFATHMLAGGANLREIQEILGHENLATTERYTKISKQQLFKNYKNLHPRG